MSMNPSHKPRWSLVSKDTNSNKADSQGVFHKEILQNFVIEQQDIVSIWPAELVQILQWVTPANKLTFGSEGEIYRVPVLLPDHKTKYYLVAKKRYDNDVKHEYKHHKDTLSILEKSQYTQVWVPKLYGKFEAIDGSELLVMEYIRWKTLYAKVIEAYLATFLQWHNYEKIRINNDKDAEQILVNYFRTDKVKEIIDTVVYDPLYYTNEKNIVKESENFGHTVKKHKVWLSLFEADAGQKIVQALEWFFKILHQNGIYHRDIWANLRNIIIDKDNKPYIIDFGKSTKIDPIHGIPEKKIYHPDKNELPFEKDEAIIDIIKAYTKK